MNNKIKPESDIAFAAATFLFNLLILLIVCGTIWAAYSILNESNSFGLFLRETALR